MQNLERLYRHFESNSVSINRFLSDSPLKYQKDLPEIQYKICGWLHKMYIREQYLRGCIICQDKLKIVVQKID